MKNQSRVKGASLVEVLLALFLIVSAASIVAATMPVATTSRAKASLMNRAMGLAQKHLEAIRGAGYANAAATQLASLGLIDSATPIDTDTYSFTNCDLAALDNPATVLPGGTGRVVVEQVDLDLRRVTVTVGWTDRGNPRSFTVGTLIANL